MKAKDIRELGAVEITARIAEIFDALTTSRPYQEKMPANFAVDRLRDLSGTAVDPAVFAGLEAVIARRQTLVFLEDTDPA